VAVVVTARSGGAKVLPRARAVVSLAAGPAQGDDPAGPPAALAQGDGPLESR